MAGHSFPRCVSTYFISEKPTNHPRWLSTALGRLPQINKNTTRDPVLQNIYSDVGMPTHLVQTNFARIALIMGRILQDVYAASSVSIQTYERYTNELEAWLSALPPDLRFHTDYTSVDLRPERSHSDRIAVVGMPLLITDKANSPQHNLELVYLGSMLLLSRPLLLEFTALVREQKSSATQLSTRIYAQTWYVVSYDASIYGWTVSLSRYAL
jgi:hypothetical protein